MGLENFSDRAKDDYQLVRKAVDEDDQTAFAELMERYRESIYFMFLKMVHNKDDAEDLMIESFGKAFKNLHNYKPSYAFSTWLYRIATNNGIDYIRKKRVSTTSLDNPFTNKDGDELNLEVRDFRPDPEEELIKTQKKNNLREVVSTLKPRYKRLIELRYFEEFSYEEIADELNIPIGTVKAQLFRAKELLYNILKGKKNRF